MAPIKGSKKIEIKVAKPKLTLVGRAFKSASVAAKGLARVEKMVGRFDLAHAERSSRALTAAHEAVATLRTALADLESVGYAPSKKEKKEKIAIAAGAQVWIKAKRLNEYAEAYSAEQLDDLFVDRITSSGKILVRIGAKPSAKMIGFVAGSHLTTTRPQAQVKEAA